MASHPLRIGARGSNLSMIQARAVQEALTAALPGIAVEIVAITTTGDRLLDTPLPLLGGKGVFTEEIEAALLAGEIDYAVHSLKDLPVDGRPDLVVGALLPRADVADALISRHGKPLATLQPGSTVGTSSPRRAAQLLAARPDLRCAPIRGNVDTRLRKVLDPDGAYDAIVLARAGLDRLGLADRITEILPLDVMLPAPGQGAIAVQARPVGRPLELLAAIDHRPTRLATTAERAFLRALGGGCSAPVAAHGTSGGREIELRGRVLALDGARLINVEHVAACEIAADADAAGEHLAEVARMRGAADLLGDRT